MISKKRELGVDLVKILACIWVVGLHTLRPGQGLINLILFYAGTICMPLFFICNGYVLFMKKEISYKYVFRKATRILFVCFMWEFLHAAAYFLYYREFRNFIESFVLDFFQKGLYFHFWFMGALIFLYLLLPLLHSLNKKEPKMFIVLIVLLGIVNIILDLSMLLLRKQFVLKVPSNLRLWNYVFYYMVGGVLSDRKEKLKSFVSKVSAWKRLCILLLSMVLMIAWTAFSINCIFEGGTSGALYSSFPVIVSSTVFFILVGMKNIKAKWIMPLAGLTMGVYITHPFVLAVFEKFVPQFLSGGSLFNFLFWILTVASCTVISWIISKIPFVKELVVL